MEKLKSKTAVFLIGQLSDTLDEVLQGSLKRTKVSFPLFIAFELAISWADALFILSKLQPGKE